eukprot:13813979-Ditylum_brightwellii.AAC.1
MSLALESYSYFKKQNWKGCPKETMKNYLDKARENDQKKVVKMWQQMPRVVKKCNCDRVVVVV